MLLIFTLIPAGLSPSFAFASPVNNPDASTGGIVAVQENGRTVYVNDEAPKPTRKATIKSAPRTRRASVLVYWSNKEKRWKPVLPPSPTAMRAARNAAAEVSSYVEAFPRLTAPAESHANSHTLALKNPNYRNLARGVAVTSSEVDAAIEQAAARHQVDANLVRAMIKVESNFNPQAVSRKGAMGLMQLMPATARRLNVSNPFDPQENVDAGVRYMKTLLNNFGGDVRLSLAAYNAGEGAVARSGGVPRISETQNYVKQITNLYWNGGPVSMRSLPTASTPIRVFRGQGGILTISNE